jgi:hypothetical protein
MEKSQGTSIFCIFLSALIGMKSRKGQVVSYAINAQDIFNTFLDKSSVGLPIYFSFQRDPAFMDKYVYVFMMKMRALVQGADDMLNKHGITYRCFHVHIR